MQISCIAGRKNLLMVSAVGCLVLLLAVNGLVAQGKPQSAFEGDSDPGFSSTLNVHEEDNLTRAQYYDRTNYQWSHESGPLYGGVSVDLKRIPGTLHTRVGSFRPGERELGIPAALRTTNRLGELGAQYFVVQVDPAAFGSAEALNAMTDMIESGGGAVMRPMAISSFLVRLTPETMAAVQGYTGVIHVEPYHPAFKLSPTIGLKPLSDPFRATSEIYTLELQLHRGEDAGAVASILSGMGGNVLAAGDTLVRVEINRSMLDEVAALEPVFLVNEWSKMFTRAAETTNVIQTGYYFAGGSAAPSPFHAVGIRGAGQILMVLDSGISLDAGDLSEDDTVPGTPGISHRKVLVNAATDIFTGGSGDTSSCDDPSLGGRTHGHVVSAGALGWATDVDVAYGTGYTASDINGNQFSLDGVAPEAKLVFYDGNVTPASGNCGDAELGGISPGLTYGGSVGTGSLGTAYTTHGARVSNFSWGLPVNEYSTIADEIDQFLYAQGDALVFVSAGNDGSDDDSDGIPDLGKLGEPATCKNCLAIGSTGNANSNGARRTERDRTFSSSTGPTLSGGVPTPSNRVAPQLMAPGQERGGLGVESEFACRSNDNDQTGSVECDISVGNPGTSFASPAAAGAALLVRDYFAKGFYPDGTGTNDSNSGDLVPNVSGSLVKAALIASADFMANVFAIDLADGGLNALGANNTLRYRFNNEQGYGRIQLDNVLPLDAWSLSPVGMIVMDGGIPGGVGNLSGLSGTMPIGGATHTETFELCDDTQELRIALAWTEAAGDYLLSDLNLEIQDPDGKVYYGNYFTDDNNRSGGTPDAGEDCPPIDSAIANGVIDAYPWSMPTCGNSIRDTENPMEAVFLSPDPDADGVTGDAFDQVAGKLAAWTIRVIGDPTISTATDYSVVISGGVCLNSSVRFDAGTYVCNDSAIITVTDVDDPSFDPAAGLTPAEITTRVTVEVLDTDGSTVVDTETGLTFTQQGTSLRFVSDEIGMSDGTQFDPGNGVLDVRHGQSIRVTYQDESTEGGVLPGDIRRAAVSGVDCTTAINFGTLVFGKIGANAIFSIDGGCEDNLRGGFEFGFPDEYMDAGESVGYGFAFNSNESETLIDAIAELRCVEVDLDSPEDCLPGTTTCADPNRLNNPPCSYVTVTDSPKIVGDIPAGVAMAAYFNVTMADIIPADTSVEMILGISSPAAGKSSSGIAISRHPLDVDEQSTYYSTDFPGGGSVIKDYNNNEVAEVVTTDLEDFNLDYRVETWTFASLLSTNPGLASLAPFDFDDNNGGFQVGVTSTTDIDLITFQPTLWGEDLNFDGLGQANELTRDGFGTPGLDYGYSTLGGCGWQTSGSLPDGDGGVWHTGRIGDNIGLVIPTYNCLSDGSIGTNRCQSTETVSGIGGQLTWFELLVTPEIHKVNGPSHTVEIVDFAWNMTQDIANDLEFFTWELDNDLDALEPVDLKSDSAVANFMAGEFGPVSVGSNPALGSPAHAGLAAGYAMFAQFDPNIEGNQQGQNGSDGTNDRSGEQSCWFERNGLSGPFGTALPPDDDIDNDSDGLTDEFVTANGPLRNFDVSAFNGPDLRVTTWEDLFGDTGTTFQAALGYAVFEGTLSDQPTGKSYGATVDDVVIEWREYELVPDSTECTGSGECAALNLQALNFFEGASLIQVNAIEPTPPASNDCDFDGTPDAPTDIDCDNDGNRDLVAEVYSTNRVDSDIIYLNNTGNPANPNEYIGEVAISSNFDVDGTLVGGHFQGGVLFIEQNGTSNPVVFAEYLDEGCNDNPDPTKRGFRTASTTVFMPSALLDLAAYNITDAAPGDEDGFADAGEEIQLDITLKSGMDVDLDNVILRLRTNSPLIECITNSSVAMGTIGPLGEASTPTPFTFRVKDTVNRVTLFEDLTASFSVTAAGDNFDTLVVPINLVIDLDLDVSGGSGITEFNESFDAVTPSFGQFTTMNLDGPLIGGNIDAETRCQYSDPGNPNANAVGREVCYLGNNRTDPFDGDLIYDFHVHDATMPDGGRAFNGINSLHLGFHDSDDAADDTMSLGQLDAIVTTLPINLSNLTNSELTIKHQVSLVDDRTVNAPNNQTPDRAIVMVKKVNNSGVEQGVWIKIAPYSNVYHIQGTDNFTECLFDPTDDGSNENDFFDPLDPFRRLGPSSTCFPEFVFTDLGNTRYDAPFDPSLIGRASETGAGLEGSVGFGTWVESKFSLARYRGFRLLLRFLYTGIAVDSSATNYNQLFALPSGWPGDDGWYIDDVTVTNTLTNPAILAVEDAITPPVFTTCDNNCTDLVADLSSDLAPTHTVSAPGQVITLTAESSTVTQCSSGTIQYQFWVDDATPLGTIDNNDTMLRDWTDNPLLTTVPSLDTDYAVVTRCSSEFDSSQCTGTNSPVAILPVTVNCPSTGTIIGWNESIGVDATKTSLVWPTPSTVYAIEGSLDTLRADGGFANSVNSCLANNVSTNAVPIAATPASGSGLYYLVRAPNYCNAVGAADWGSATRNSELSGAAGACP